MLFSGIPTIDTRNEQVDFSLPISVPWGTTVCATGTDGLPFDLTGSTIEAGLLDTVGAEILSFSMAVDMTTSCISLSLTGTEIEALGLGWYYWYLRVELSGETEYTYWVGGRWNVHRVYTYGPRRDLPNPDVVDVVVGSEIIASVNVCAVSGAGGGGSGDLLAANNLSDVDNAAASLANIGGATAAQGALADTALQTVDIPTDINSTGGTPSATTFLRGDGVWAQPAGTSGGLLAANNLSDVDDAATSRTNLGLGTAATTSASDYATAAQGALADTALQDASAFATAAQGALADTALQNAAAFATAAQGVTADSALQIVDVPTDINATGTPGTTTFLRGDGVWAEPTGTSGDLLAANNLSDVDDAPTSLANLGGATAAQGALADTALQNAAAFATAAQGSTADSALQVVAVPSDITATGTPSTTTFLRGDGVWAEPAGTAGDLLAANNLSDVANAATSRTNLGAAPLASPTFTGTTTTAALTATGNAAIVSASPDLRFDESDQASGSRVTRMHANGGNWFLSVAADNGAATQVVMQFNRSGAVVFSAPSVTVPAPTTTGHALRWSSAANVASLELNAGGLTGLGDVVEEVSTANVSGAYTLVDGFGIYDLTMTADSTLTFPTAPASGDGTSFLLILRGAFTPTLPATVDWAGGTPPAYVAALSMYAFTTVDGGAMWLGVQAGAGFA